MIDSGFSLCFNRFLEDSTVVRDIEDVFNDHQEVSGCLRHVEECTWFFNHFNEVLRNFTQVLSIISSHI